jgi:hypothetical protein
MVTAMKKTKGVYKGVTLDRKVVDAVDKVARNMKRSFSAQVAVMVEEWLILHSEDN